MGENSQNIGFAKFPWPRSESLLPTLMAGESVVTHGAFIGVEIEVHDALSLQSQYGFTGVLRSGRHERYLGHGCRRGGASNRVTSSWELTARRSKAHRT